MLKRVEILAAAKLNLALMVTGRRADGYHLLDSVMQSISLFDRVRLVRTNAEVTVTCPGWEALSGEENLAYRAIRRFCEAVGAPFFGVHADIDKVIPTEAGLGGGSADAAATLVALNLMFGAGLSPERLHEIGLSLGADVPFMLQGGTMRATGIGEELTKLTDCPELWVLVVKPEFGMSTAEVFGAFDRCAEVPPGDIESLVASIENRDIIGIGALLCNQLEAATGRDEIPKLKDILLGNGALGASMTGSGSAVFGLFPGLESAKQAMERLERTANRLYLVKPVPYGWRIVAKQAE